MIDSYREMDSALIYVSVECFARDEECFKLMCTIDLAIEARKALGSYLEEERNQVQTDCPFVFLSQRARKTTRLAGDHPRRLTEGGLHAW